MEAAGGYGKVAEQTAQLNDFIALNLDAVLVAPAAFDGFDKALEQLTQKSVKVVDLATEVKSKNVSVGVLADDREAGTLMAKYLCENNPNATVATIPGPAGTEWNQRMFDGFVTEAKRSCPNANLVGNAYRGGSTLEDGQTQASELLVKYPKTDYVYAASLILGKGAIQAIERMKSKAQVISGAVTEGTPDDIKSGKLAMTATYSSIIYGRAAVQYAIRLLNGDPLPGLHNDPKYVPYPYAYVPIFSLTKKNVATYDIHKYDAPPKDWKIPALQ
jgi:ABC-type sugar transport system substrate-binding protein